MGARKNGSSNPAKLKPGSQEVRPHLRALEGTALFWSSSLFHDVYLRNDVPNKYKQRWDQEDAGPFYVFCEQFRNLCDELKGEKPESWSERTTINKFIKPVLELLGWGSPGTNQPWLEDESFTIREAGEAKVYKPDFIIVDNQKLLRHIESKKGDEKLAEARSSTIISVEAKYWGRIESTTGEDKKRSDKKDQSEATRSLEFDEQCLKYVELLKHDYGILTDGRTWRLYHRELSSGSFRRYYQFNLGALLKQVSAGLDIHGEDYKIFVENAKYFYHIFSKSALYSSDGSRRFVDELIDYSRKYANSIEEDLRLRFITAMSITCNGFRRSLGKSYRADYLDMIRNVAESYIFNILFIRFCESKNILPIQQNGDYRKKSLSNIIDKIDSFDPAKEEDGLNTDILRRRFSESFTYTPDGTDLYDGIHTIVDILQKGVSHADAKFAIKGFKETVFSTEELNFSEKYKLTNQEVVQLLFELTYIKSETPGKYQQIAYSFFAPQHLGSIYESFLEFRLEEAQEDMAFVKKQWQKAAINSEKVKSLGCPTVKKGYLFFSPNNTERKATGSYYTPDSVVQFILDQSLSESLKTKTAKQLLSMKICDPAMGSAHFLAGALNYMAGHYIQKLSDETLADISLTRQKAKALILKHCIYGVDMNFHAVKLAKLSLWLESATDDEPLEPLNDQLKCANSLLDESLWTKTWQHGFDAVVGNPPYLGEKGHKPIFEQIKAGWLGPFYLGKMDLFYFFFHLGLNILKPGGKLGFITTNYYPTANGAKKLREDFKARSTLDLLMNLNEVRVFGDAAGQHNMITLLGKGTSERPAKCITTTRKDKVSDVLLQEIWIGKDASVADITQNELYDGEHHYIRMPTGGGTTSGDSAFNGILDKIASSSVKLGSLFNINTGIQTGADKVSQKHLEKFPKLNAQKGDGIFVLSKEEVQGLGLSKEDAKILKPFFKNSDVAHFQTSAKTELYSPYLGRDCTKPPEAILAFLNKFKPILQERREVKNGVIKWFQLQWPRTEDIFTSHKIVAPQRSKMNTFGYNESSWYASADVYFITEKEAVTAAASLKYALGILNSKPYYIWLYMRGKRKGESLELYQTPLSETPLLQMSAASTKKVETQADKLIQDNTNAKAFAAINQLIYEHLNLTPKEIAAIEDFYDSKLNSTTTSEEDEDDDE